MSTATKEKKVEKKLDEARSALVSDIQELKAAGNEAVAKLGSKLPWVVGGVAGLLLIGVVIRIARPPQRSLFGKPERSFLGTVVRAAALSATGLLAKRYATRAVDRFLPEPQQTQPEP